MLERLCVIGVGLIGGSVALAARRFGIVRQIVGVDSKLEMLKLAQSAGVIDQGFISTAQGVQGADGVVIAVPVGKIQSVFEGLAPTWSQEAFYTDVSSTKMSVIAAAEAVFGQMPANFVPAHPIAGREISGVEAATGDLFQGKRVILTPVPCTDLRALEKVQRFWQSLGAEVHTMSAAWHDRVLAATSHLPHAAAYALVNLLGHMDEKNQVFRYAGSGFGDFTRIASSDPEIWADICVANAEEISSVMQRFEQELNWLREKIVHRKHQVILNYFRAAQAFRKKFLEQQARS